jgi:hypothetical protein
MATATKTGATTFTTPNDREVVITRAVDAPRRLVFAAWTDPGTFPSGCWDPRVGRCPSARWTSAPVVRGAVWRKGGRRGNGNVGHRT